MKTLRATLHPTGEDLLISTSAGLALPPPKPGRVNAKSPGQTADSREVCPVTDTIASALSSILWGASSAFQALFEEFHAVSLIVLSASHHHLPCKYYIARKPRIQFSAQIQAPEWINSFETDLISL